MPVQRLSHLFASSWLPELLREGRYERASHPAAQGHEPDEDRTVEEQRECGEAEQRTSADPAFTTGSLEYVDGKRQVEYKGREQAWNVAAQNQGGSDMKEDVQQHDGLEAQQKKNAATPTSMEVAARCDQEREDRHWKQDQQELRISHFSQKRTQR